MVSLGANMCMVGQSVGAAVTLSSRRLVLHLQPPPRKKKQQTIKTRKDHILFHKNRRFSFASFNEGRSRHFEFLVRISSIYVFMHWVKCFGYTSSLGGEPTEPLKGHAEKRNSVTTKDVIFV